MELVAGYAPAKGSTGNEPSPAMTATTNVPRLSVGEDTHQGRREDEGRDQERHAGNLSPVRVAAHQDKWSIAASKRHWYRKLRSAISPTPLPVELVACIGR
jgi:hypothetical protein